MTHKPDTSLWPEQDSSGQASDFSCSMAQDLDAVFKKPSDFHTPYGDLTELNTTRLILDTVGKETLRLIAEDALTLINSSLAIYEADGDYALQMFSSSWCRMLDEASRNLCQTDDNAEALSSGRWHCHEFCWGDLAKQVIASGQSMDRECVGGIRMYGLPIISEHRVIGAIAFGYGTPPRDRQSIQKLAHLYHIDERTLFKAASEYVTRPKFVEDLAKKRLAISARLIGEIVAHSEARKTLQKKQELLYRILEEGPFCTLVIDRSGRITFANKMAETVFGIPKKQICDLQFNSAQWHVTDIDGNLLCESDLPFIQIMSKKRSVHNIQHILHRPDGQEKILNISGTPLLNNSGEIDRIVFVIIDITAQHKTLRKVEEQKEFLDVLMDIIPLPLFYKLRKGSYLGCNRAFERFFGISKDRLLAASPGELKTTFHIDPLLGEDENTILHNEHILEGTLRDAQGNNRNVILNFDTFDYRQEKDIGILGIISDVTIRKQYEKELFLAQQELKQIIESLSAFLIVLQRDKRIKYFNGTAEKIFNIRHVEVENQSLFSLSLTHDCPEIRAGLDKCAREKRSIHLPDIRYTTQNGTEGYLGITINPALDIDNAFDGFILIGADITAKKVMESQLTQAQKLESIGQLAAGIAHEINTPTQYVGNNVDFLDDAFKDIIEALTYIQEQTASDQKDDTGSIFSNIQQMLDKIDLEYLLEEIPLALSQSQEGIQRISEIVKSMKQFAHPGGDDKTPLDINQALVDTILVTKNEWKYHAEMETDLDPELPLVSCYQGEIKQVFLNIIVNAAQAIAESKEKGSEIIGKIGIHTTSRDDLVEIRISDNGPGMSEDTKQRIFDPFFTTKEVGKGTGQGLNLAYRTIVNKHHGTIEVESEMGQGAVFIIRLPID
jgi:PAS domain S-box-containing protein